MQEQHDSGTKVNVLIRNMSTLEENSDVSFVSVRTWIVDRRTGQSYVLGTAPLGMMNSNSNNNNNNNNMMDVALPAVTFPFDIRRRLSTQPEWNEIVQLDVSPMRSIVPSGGSAAVVVVGPPPSLRGDPNAVLLFELLSLGNESIQRVVFSGKAPDCVTPLAWGFLDLVSPAGVSNEGQDHLVQLFRAPTERGFFRSIAVGIMSVVTPTPQSRAQVGQQQQQQQAPFPVAGPISKESVPPVFHDFASTFNRNDTYGAALSVQFQFVDDEVGAAIGAGAAPLTESQAVRNSRQQKREWRNNSVEPLRLRTYDTLLPAERLVHQVITKQAPPMGGSGGGGGPGSSLALSAGGGSAGTGTTGAGGGAARTQGGTGSSVFQLGASTVQRQRESRRAKKHETFLANNSFSRLAGERCLPPSHLLHRMEIAGEVTAMATHNGVLALAISCDFRNFICFYDVLSANMPLVGQVPGHIDYVHHMQFNRSGDRLVSCSADKTARVWKTDQLGFFVKTDSEEQAVCAHTLPHPFHVYDADFIGGNALVTCGFDSSLYLWSLHTGLLIGTAQNITEAFFRAVCTGGAVADSKVYALDSDFVLSTWRPMEEEAGAGRTAVSSLVLRIRVRVPGAVSLVVSHSTVVLLCQNDHQHQHGSGNHQRNESDSPHGSDVFLCVVDGALLNLLFKISIPRSSSPLATRNLLTRSYSSAAATTGGKKQQQQQDIRFFPDRDAAGKVFILPDGRLIGYADRASRVLFFDALTGELFSSTAGVAMTGAADVPLQCIEWSKQLHVCVSASALAHTDQGRISEIVVCGRPRAEGEECTDGSRAEAVRAYFGGDVTRRLHAATSARGGNSYYYPNNNNNNDNNDDDDGNNNKNNIAGSPLPSVARSRFTSAMSRLGGFQAMLGSAGGRSVTQHPRERLVPEPNLEGLAQDPSTKMMRIVSFWREIVGSSSAPSAAAAAAPPRVQARAPATAATQPPSSSSAAAAATTTAAAAATGPRVYKTLQEL